MRNSTACRWGDNDTYFGPFTFARDSRGYRPLSITIGTGHSDEDPKCRLRISAFGFTLIAALPPIVRPERRWVDTSRYEWSQGSGGYWDELPRSYGFSLHDGHLSVYYGRQTHDSSTEQQWGCFLPWTQWRHVRHSLYGLDGSLFLDLPKYGGRHGRSSWDHHHILTEACPAATFAFRDFDGEELTATTKIEEREWLLGEKWCGWLSLFTKPKVRRSLDIRFSGETGRRKGSWKGGTTGHGIAMLPDELHEAAFRRYCAEHDMAFVGAVQSGDDQ